MKDLIRFHVRRPPRCTDHEEFNKWVHAAKQYPPSYKVWFCTDCTNSFQLQMKKEGRCDHPYIKFKVSDDEIEGYIDPEDSKLHYQTIQKLNEGKR